MVYYPGLKQILPGIVSSAAPNTASAVSRDFVDQDRMLPQLGKPVFITSDLQTALARLGVYILCFFDYGVRNSATWIFILVIAISLLCLSRATWSLLRPFLLLWLVNGIYICLSFLHALPAAWTKLYEPGVILRQCTWVFVLPLVANLFRNYVLGALQGHALREYLIVTSLLIANFFVSGILVADWTYPEWSYGPFGYLWAPFSIYLVVAGWGMIMEPRRIIWFLFCCQAIAAIALADGAQTKLTYVCFLTVVLFRRLRRYVATTAVLVMISFVIVGYVWTWMHPMEVVQRDAAVRALMVANAFDAAKQSGFIGVGYGTEGLKNYYPELGIQSFTSFDDAFILIGVHNAFFDILMRMGLPGIIAFAWALFSLAYPIGRNERISTYRKVLFAALVLNLSVNVALQSPFHMTGVAAMLGASFVAQQCSQLRGNSKRQVNSEEMNLLSHEQ